MASRRTRRPLRPAFRASLPSLGLLLAVSGAVWTACGDDGAVIEEPIDPSTSASTGPGGSGGEAPDLSTATGNQQREVVALAFDPPTQKLVLDGATPQTATFVLRATFEDGQIEDVAAEALQFDRPDLAELVPGPPVELTAGGAYAGKGTIFAVFRGVEATAHLDVEVHAVDVDTGVPQSAKDALAQPTLDADPALSQLLYPYDQTVFPQGLTSPLVMWTAPGDGEAIYRIRYSQPNYSYERFFSATKPASVRMPQARWDKMVASNPGGPIEVELRRYDGGQNKAFTSAKQTWTIAPASLRGAIYYWSVDAPPGVPEDQRYGVLSRINPGGQHEVLLGGKCVGCHAVSSDGSTLVGTHQEQLDGKPGLEFPWATYELPDMKQIAKSPDKTFGGSVALNNDGKYVVYGDRDLRLGDAATGQEIPNSGIELSAIKPGTATPVPYKNSYGLMAPVFSPDGLKLAAVDGEGPWYPYLENGKLLVLNFDPTTQKFSGLSPLTPASAFPAEQRAINYPSFTPDNAWLAFQVSDEPTGCQLGDPDVACSNITKGVGRLYLQSLAGEAPVDLTTLNDGSPNPADHNVAFEPTFMPIERGGYYWVVFTSMRDWGHRITGEPNNGKKRLWVAAINKNPASATDPSTPAFFLEGQDETKTNMRGFWALSQCIPSGGGGTCEAGFECCDGFCDKGKCVTPQEFSCVGVGEACQTQSDCCNDEVVRCIDGVCALPGPN